MKKVALLLLIAVLPVVAFSQKDAIDKLFDKYGEKDGYTTVYIHKNLFKLAAQMDLDDPQVNALVDDLSRIRILAADDDWDTGEKVDFMEELKDYPFDDFEVLMTVKEADTSVKFLSKEKDGKITHLLLIVGGNDDNAVISIEGLIDLATIGKLASSIDGSGMKHLEELNDKDWK
jgi:hypothetical protein